MDDEERFTAIFRAFHAQVTAYARRRTPGDVAQDVVAATFLAAWRHLDDLPPDPLPWLYRAASFEVAAQGRKDRRHLHMQDRFSALPAADLRHADHADQVAAAEQWKEAFAGLSDQDREILSLVAWEQLRPRQAAAVLGCSPVAFNVRLHRARRRLESRIDALEAASDFQARSTGPGAADRQCATSPPQEA